MEDGEINDGFLGVEEMENRKALADAHGEGGGGMSWVEAVILGAGQVTAVDAAATKDVDIEQQPEGSLAVGDCLSACSAANIAVACDHMIWYETDYLENVICATAACRYSSASELARKAAAGITCNLQHKVESRDTAVEQKQKIIEQNESG